MTAPSPLTELQALGQAFDADPVADFIRKVANAAEAIGLQAGVGGMETAGGIISYLAAHPEQIAAFSKNGSVFDLPDDWFSSGCLTWHAENGKVVHPSEARAAREAKRAAAGVVPAREG